MFLPIIGLSGVASAASLTFTTAPTLSGTVAVGSPLTVNPGSAPATSPGTESITYTEQWYECPTPVTTSNPGNCVAITPTATGTTFTPGVGQNGYYVTAAVTATPGATNNSASDTVSVYFAPQSTVMGETPVSYDSSNSSYVAPTGTASLGAPALTVPTTAWLGSVPIVSYQWYRCSASIPTSPVISAVPSTCGGISGATSSTYTLQGSDAGFYIAVAVTASNAVSSATIVTPTTSAVLAGAPVAGTAPVLTSNTAAGTTLSLQTAPTWSGTPTPVSANFTYQWYRCSSQQSTPLSTVPSFCLSISGATAATYSLAAGDVGNYVLVAVTATNGVSPNSTQVSASTALVSGSAPVNQVAPAISPTGTISPGEVLTVSTGSWSGSATQINYSYQWYSCSAAITPGGIPSGTTLSGCTGISGQTAQNYTVTTAVTGRFVLATVTESNGIGTPGVSYSASTTAVGAGVAPTGTGVPVITQTPSNGATLSSSTGTWSGAPSPTTIAYQWSRCSTSSSSSCVAISGATGATYALTSSDLSGQYIMVTVTGSNGVGTNATQSSLLSGPFSLTTPANVTPPTITGSFLAGSPLTVSNGTWNGIPQPTFTYQYYSCTSSQTAASGAPGSACTPIGASTSLNTFTPDATFNGKYILVAVTASVSGSGTATFSSATTAQTISAVAPSNTSPPTVPASASTTTMLSASVGTWLGNPAPSFNYQWYYCTSPVFASTTSAPSGCVGIPGANSANYLPSGTYVNDYFVVAVTGYNGVTSGGNIVYVTVFSASTQHPLAATLAVTGLTITGTASVGNTLTSSATVLSIGTYSTTYQWYACTVGVSASTSLSPYCTAIVGATAYSFAPAAAQVGYYLTLSETVTGTSGSATAFAASTALVTTSIPGAPTNVYGVAGVGSATVTWTAPTTGLAVASYTVTSLPAGGTCTSATTSCVVTGLLRTTSYTFTVTATNTYGTSPASVASLAVTPLATEPSAAIGVTAVPSNGSATVSWTAAVANGYVVTGYTVASSPAGGSCSTTATSCVVTGLTNGTVYTFSVTATNLLGNSPASVSSLPVTPMAIAPSAPTGVTAAASNGRVTVKWTAAVSNGSPVTGYVVTATLGTTVKTCQTTTLTCAVTGLVNGKVYAVSVMGLSAAGSSMATSALNVHLLGVPTAPSIGSFFRRSGGFGLKIRPAKSNGGAVVKFYQYSLNGGKTWVSSKSGHSLVMTVDGLEHSHLYRVMVRAVNAVGPGGRSALKLVFTA